MFNFTPLLGAQSASPASQSLLELEGGVKILIDVGWDESFDVNKLRELERQVPTISVILLTHATTAHIAAFAHCCKHFPLFTRIPIYATTPVISLGRTLLQDLYASTPLASSVIPHSALSESNYSYPATRDGGSPDILFQPPTAEEIAGYFSLIHPLKYSQPHQPLPAASSPPLNGLTITAYGAGHTLGGTIWHIQHGLESVVYAVDWNQAREHILSGAAWLGAGSGAEVIEPLRRPTALICSSRGAQRVALAGGRKRRDEILLGMIKETIARGGTVLIPSDSSARVLELAYLLEDAWASEAAANMKEESSLLNAKLYFASKTCGATMRYARSMLEWMEEGIVREFETASGAQEGRQRKDNQKSGSKNQAQDQRLPSAPFDFKYLKLLERKSRLDRVLSATAPKVIIASDASMDWGFSKEAVRRIADDNRNLVILLDKMGVLTKSKQGLGRLLWELWEERRLGSEADDALAKAQEKGAVELEDQEARLDTSRAEPLVGNEVSLYQQYLARQRQLQNTLQAERGTTLETSADVVDDRSSSTSTTSDDSDVEHQGKVLNVTSALTHSKHKLGLTDAELGINILLRHKGIHDYDVRGKRGREKMFPFVAKRRRVDDFGDLIRPEEYLRAEERDEVDGEDMRNGTAKEEAAVGQKRKWDATAVRAAAGGRRMSNGTVKRRKTETNGNAPNTTSFDGGEQADNQSSEDDASDESDTEPTEGAVGPRKVVQATETIRLNFRVAFVDFSGLHDKRSLHMLIPLIRPRKLILVGGEQDETLALATDCRKLLGADAGTSENTADVFTPVVGRTVDASVDTNAWAVKLSQPLVKRLHWQNVRGLGIVAITGRLEASSTEEEVTEEIASKKLKMSKNEAQDAPETGAAKTDAEAVNALPVLDVVPPNMAAATRSVAQPLHVGDLRLADLRKLMQASGYTVEFRGEGTLLIDGMIAVRKTATGKIEVEGGLNLHGPRQPEGTFYAVKRKIYEGLAVVAGG